MNDETEKSQLPEYLLDFMNGSPSSFAKLELVWDDLFFETKLKLFHEIENVPQYSFLKKKFILKVLQSNNPYLRYLAAKSIHAHGSCGEWEQIKEKIESDPELLVKYCLYENNPYSFISNHCCPR